MPPGSLAQLGEHLPYKQRVIGSSPIGPIYKVAFVILCSQLFYWLICIFIWYNINMPMWLNWQSSWLVISRLSVRVRSSAYGWVPEWPKGADCKSVSDAFEGSNPSPSISYERYFVNDAGWSSLEARWAHNPKVVGSNPAPAIFVIAYLWKMRYTWIR